MFRAIPSFHLEASRTVLSSYSPESNALLPKTSTWQKATVDLSGYAGQVIYLAFEFDSIDSVNNRFEGFYVDDVSLSAVCTCSRCRYGQVYLSIQRQSA